jgi:hypothetical protein
MHMPPGGSEPLLSPKRRSVPSQNHLENPGQNRCALRRAKSAFSVFFFILVCFLGKDAVGASNAPIVSLSATSLNPGWYAVGTTSGPEHLWVTNSGNATLTITSVTLTGANASDFALTNSCGSSLAAGAECLVSFTFTPSAPGTRTASLNIADNAAGSPQTVTLTGTGTGTGPAASVSPTSLTFASQAVGATSAAQTLTLSNTGNAALSITSVAVTGTNASDFAQTNTCGSSVAAGANCTISVTFTPAATGTFTAAVTLTDNAAGSPQTVSLSGTVGSVAANISPSSLTFGDESVDMTSSPQTVTVDNTGSAALSITSIAFTGADPADFTAVDTCSPSVAAGGTCTIAISFMPAASGAVTAALTITDSATGSPQSVALTGTGTHDVILNWTASPTSGVVGYNVYRGTTSGGESATPINSAPINAITYADENVTAGTEYYYLVMAVASNGSTLSAASNEASATVPTP